MKTKVLLIVLALIISSSFLIDNCQGQWVQVQIPTNGVYKILNYNGDVLAGGIPNVYKSTNLGQNWTVFYQTTYDVSALSNVDGNVWVSSLYNNVYTTNNGLNWTTSNLVKYVYYFASINGRIFAGTESFNCYYTDNGGVNWTHCPDIFVDVKCFLNTVNIFLAGTSNGVYYTTNNGANWNEAQLGGYPIHALVKNPSKLFAGANFSGVWTTTNGGFNWTQTSLNNVSIEAMETYGNNNIIAGTWGGGVYVSTNNGLNWSQRNEGLGNANINTLAIVGNTIFAGTSNIGLWKRPLSEIVSIQNISTETPLQFSLEQNYPNPFNPTTTIKFSIPNGFPIKTFGNDKVVLKVYDVMGREVETLVNERLQAGTYETQWNASAYSSGVYFYKIQAGEFSETKRMLLIK